MTRRRRLGSLLAIQKGPAFREESWDVMMTSFLGHQRDPFHTADAYGLHRRGATDFQILNHRLAEPNVVRGACFFEGSVAYRLDPGLAARVLGLVR